MAPLTGVRRRRCRRDGCRCARTGASVIAEPVEVVLYSRPGCHLCEVAARSLEALRRTLAFDLREVDIESDPALEQRFLLEIPAVEVAGEVVSTAPVEIDRVRRAVVAVIAARRAASDIS